ncbi:hypothetical protein NDI56_16805 [Haloarcula sp. S1CR25-12]|uniref:Uncharacterized protein n=2 Tax=Haloarcula saliterrae TaxID=2950534 RepID=A0ABU2FFM0_9EURY|nr:hypothetical protein [Haloarcula sp. S1CR25-12]
MSNTVLTGAETVEYLDGAPRASLPSTVLCYDCARDVRDYLEARKAIENEDSDGLAPFGEADAEAVLDRMVDNEHLVLELGRESGYGIRSRDGVWKHAVFRAPGPSTIERLTRAEVRTRILNAKRLTLKQFDPVAWDRFDTQR